MRKSRTAILSCSALLLAAFAAFGSQHRPPQIAAQRPPQPSTDAGAGRLISLRLDSAPFPDQERSDGYYYDGEQFPRSGHYDDSTVAVFIPPDFAPKRVVDLVFFFHGWYSSVPESIQNFSLLRQFSESGARALLVIPETARDAPDSYGGKLEDQDGFDNLVTELLARLHDDGILPRVDAGAITLVGHSGAYRVMASIIGERGAAKKVHAVYLFDGLYDDVERYAAWISSGNGRFVAINSEEGDPAENARQLIGLLQDDGIHVETGTDAPDDDSKVLRHRVVFLSTPYDHNSLVSSQDELKRVLAANVSPGAHEKRR